MGNGTQVGPGVHRYKMGEVYVLRLGVRMGGHVTVQAGLFVYYLL